MDSLTKKFIVPKLKRPFTINKRRPKPLKDFKIFFEEVGEIPKKLIKTLWK